jgi:hypothetical protein
MIPGFPSVHFRIKAFPGTHMIEDFDNIDVSILILHGDDDLIVLIADTASKSAMIVGSETLPFE